MAFGMSPFPLQFGSKGGASPYGPELFDPENVTLNQSGNSTAQLLDGVYVLRRNTSGNGSLDTGVDMLIGEQFLVEFTFHRLPVDVAGWVIYSTRASPFDTPDNSPAEGPHSYEITALQNNTLSLTIPNLNRGAGYSTISIKKKLT